MFKKCCLLFLGALVFSGCASTLTSKNILIAPHSSTALNIGFNTIDLDIKDAATLAPYNDNFHYILMAESKGQISKGGSTDLRLFVKLKYNPEFFEPNIILGTASMVLPFLGFISESNDADYYVDYTLKDKTGATVYQNKFKGEVEGNITGYWIGRLFAAQDLRGQQAKYVMENAARHIINDLNINDKEISRLEKSSKQNVLYTAKPSPPVLNSVVSDVDDLPEKKIQNNGNAYAIVISVEKYRQKLPDADFSNRDAQTVSDYLIKVLGYPEENVVNLTNEHAALGDFVKYFEKWLPNNVEQGSTVFIYYSGHGAPDPRTGGAYLVPYDGDPSFIAETGYSLTRMYDALGKLPAKEIIVALDSCFSGAGGRSVIAKGARPLVMNLQNDTVLSTNITVLSASSGAQISSTYDEKGHGLFTYFLLKGIKNEDVVNMDGSIRMDDLFGYIKPQVERIARKQYNNEQTPQLLGGK